ncbi:MAG: LacI family DNA-binding transcriptional regulator [Mobilitalea sp.]
MGQYRNKVSLQDIADRLGISKYAVSLALNDKPGVSDELRKEITKLAIEMDYQGNKKKQAKKNSSILVLIPEYISNDTFFYNSIYWSVEADIKRRGFKAVLAGVNADMQEKLEYPNFYYEMEFCGIIMIGIFTKKYVRKILSSGLPVISIDHYYDDIPMDAVVTANLEGSYSIVSYLIEKGHKDIGYVGSIEMTSSLYERWCGYNKAMLYHGLKVNAEHCILNSSPLNVLFAEVEELDRLISGMKTMPTAWFCGGDRIAINLINVLSRKNIKIPEEISVAGFDDIEAANMIIPSLTTVRIDRQRMGQEAVDLLIRRLEQNGEIQKISIYGDMVIRESVKPLSDD